MQQKSVIFVVISVLAVALICGSFTPFIVSAEPPDPGWKSSNDCGSWGGGRTGVRATWCCWTENGVKYCQTCVPITEGPNYGDQECTPKEKQSLEQPPTPQPFDPTSPLQGGVLEQPPTPPLSVPPTAGENILQQDLGILEEVPSQGVPPLKQGQDFLPEESITQQEQQPADQGAAELPPVTEGSQPSTVEEEPPVPVCQEGLEFNEDLGFCVPTECPEGQELNKETGTCVLEAPEAAEESPVEEQQQPSEQGDGSEDNSNNN